MNTYQTNAYHRGLFAGFKCEAVKLHHADCPGTATALTIKQFCTHHVQPREQDGSDDYDNLLFVWNGPTGLGADGCHGRIHKDRADAKTFGYLIDSPTKWATTGEPANAKEA